MKIAIYIVVVASMVLALTYSSVYARGHNFIPMQMPQAETVWVNTSDS